MSDLKARLISHTGWVFRHIGSWESPLASRIDGKSCLAPNGELRFFHRTDFGTVTDSYSRWLDRLTPSAATNYSRSTLKGSFCTNCMRLFDLDAVSPRVTARKRPVFDTDSTEPEPGDLYFSPWPGQRDSDGRPHLIGVCPDGHIWDIDGKASNCSMPDEPLHRCWVRHGAPPLLTVDKQGYTCSAGGGSVNTGHWHGFLRGGLWVAA